jgi:phosphoglycolate phosphatase
MQHLPFQAILFDIDGTLFQTEKVALPAFRKTFDELRENGLFQGDTPEDGKLTSVFGMTIPEVWETLLPDTDIKLRDRANEMFAHWELYLMQEGEGALYPGVKEALQALHDQNIKLYTCSNGEKRYVETVLDTQRIHHYFTKLYSAGEYKTEKKEELVARILQDHHLSPDITVMVGDRQSDITAAKKNNLPAIGCKFGFADPGELKEADIRIDHFDQLLSALETIAQAKVK